jgi:hypothetical protein
MIRELFTNIRPRRGHYMLVLAALLILVAGAGLAQNLSLRTSEASNLDHVAGQVMGNGKETGAFSINGQPSGDVRSADADSRFGDATAYDDQLENLARQGRAAFAAIRLPVSADAYAYYLDRLRILGQNAQTAVIKPVDANSFSAYLDQLRRLASETGAVDTQGRK